MTRALGVLVAAILFLAAAPSFAQSCRTEIRRTQQMINQLRPGPNTTAAKRHLRRARNAQTDRRCRQQVGLARDYAQRSRALDRRTRS